MSHDQDRNLQDQGTETKTLKIESQHVSRPRLKSQELQAW